MRALLLLALLLPATIRAEAIPAGCYVADFYRTDQCWEGAGFAYEWIEFASTQESINYYGSPITSMIQAGYVSKVALNNCSAAYSTAVAAYDQKVSLIKKLRKKCGAPCKNIK